MIRQKSFGIFTVGILAASLCFPVLAQDKSEPADYVFINGSIHTMDVKNPKAQAITFQGNKITYVGGANGIQAEIGAGTKIIDLQGKMVLPGFVDGHIHAVAGGILMNGVDLQTDDVDEIFQRIRDYVKNYDGDVVLGYVSIPGKMETPRLQCWMKSSLSVQCTSGQ